MEMTKERLEAYQSEKEEIREIQYRLDHLTDNDAMVGNSTIFDYSTGYPRPQAVVGTDYKKQDRITNKNQQLLQKLEKNCEEVELWIAEIPDSMTRRIFQMYYIEGVRQQVIARKVHLSQSVVSEKISKYLKSDKNDKKV